MKTILAVALTLLLSTQASAEGIPCWIRCHRPPEIHSATDVACVLRRVSNPPVNCLARTVGFLTTYCGKILGIQGWRDYHLKATVNGQVVQAVGSTDGLYTIDLKIKQLAVDGRPVTLPESGSRYIRVEVFPFVRKGAPLPVCTNDQITVSGKLMWDADGFLEIHPKRSGEIAVSTGGN